MRLLRNSGDQICVTSEILYPIINTNYKPSSSVLGLTANAPKNSARLKFTALASFIILFIVF